VDQINDNNIDLLIGIKRPSNKAIKPKVQWLQGAYVGIHDTNKDIAQDAAMPELWNKRLRQINQSQTSIEH
jgi:hypothetical protein